MSNEPIDTAPVEPSVIDDLDSFSDLFHNVEKTPEPAKQEDEAPEEIENDDVKPVEESGNDEETGENKEEAPDEEEKPEDKPKKVNRFQERINELTAKAREAERANQELEKKLAELALKQSEAVNKPDSTSAVDDNSPNPDAKNEDGSDKYPLGEFDPSYIRDLTRYTIQRESAIAKEQEAKENASRQEQEARAALQNQWVEKLNSASEQYDDFLDKTIELEDVFSGIDPGYSDYLVQTIKSLDHGPDVLYYFANNLEEAQKFVQSGPLAATLALGEVNAMFKGQTRKETKVSKAPPPPQVNKGSKTRTVITGDTDDLEAFSNLFFTGKT